MDPLDAGIPGTEITFESQSTSKTVVTDKIGRYEIDLPVGNYVMTVRGPNGFRIYQLPLFRLKEASVILNAMLLVGSSCGEWVISNRPGHGLATALEACRYRDLFPLPSDDGSPLVLAIRYGKRTETDTGYAYSGENTGEYQAPVFVTYDLFSLQGESVTYDPQGRTIRATGHVSWSAGSSETKRADATQFRIDKDGFVRTVPPVVELPKPQR
jgi:hypothetical protein